MQASATLLRSSDDVEELRRPGGHGLQGVSTTTSYSGVPQPRQQPRPRVGRLAPPPRAGQRRRLRLHRLGLAPLPRVDEPHEVGGVRVRGHLRHGVDQAVADGHALQVDPPLLRQLGVRGQYERAGRGDGLAGVALAGEVERAGAELRRLGGEEGLERGEDVLGDDGLVRGDGGGGRRRAVSGAERAVDEEEPEAAVPREGVAREGDGVGADEVGAELEEVADEAGAARPALQPEEERRGGRRRERVGGLVEGEEERGVGGRDGEVARLGRERFIGEHQCRPRTSRERGSYGEEDEDEQRTCRSHGWTSYAELSKSFC